MYQGERMNVSGIRPYSGFYQYNSIKLDELRNQQIADTQPTGSLEAADAQSEEERRRQKEQEIAAAAAKQTFDSYDFAQRYKPDELFDLKGADSDINSLDIEKAVNDLSKDQILRQYQYFVGSDTGAADAQTQQAALRSGENFTL